MSRLFYTPFLFWLLNVLKKKINNPIKNWTFLRLIFRLKHTRNLFVCLEQCLINPKVSIQILKGTVRFNSYRENHVQFDFVHKTAFRIECTCYRIIALKKLSMTTGANDFYGPKRHSKNRCNVRAYRVFLEIYKVLVNKKNVDFIRHTLCADNESFNHQKADSQKSHEIPWASPQSTGSCVKIAKQTENPLFLKNLRGIFF